MEAWILEHYFHKEVTPWRLRLYKAERATMDGVLAIDRVGEKDVRIREATEDDWATGAERRLEVR